MEKITETPFKHVWHVRETIKDGYDVYLPGFYFVDETQILNGPFNNLESAKKALNHHVETYLQDPNKWFLKQKPSRKEKE